MLPKWKTNRPHRPLPPPPLLPGAMAMAIGAGVGAAGGAGGLARKVNDRP